MCFTYIQLIFPHSHPLLDNTLSIFGTTLGQHSHSYPRYVCVDCIEIHNSDLWVEGNGNILERVTDTYLNSNTSKHKKIARLGRQMLCRPKWNNKSHLPPLQLPKIFSSLLLLGWPGNGSQNVVHKITGVHNTDQQLGWPYWQNMLRLKNNFEPVIF